MIPTTTTTTTTKTAAKNDIRRHAIQPLKISPLSTSAASTAAVKTDTPAIPPPTPSRKYHFFQNPTITPSGIAVITFDNPDKSVNTISFALKDEAKTLWNDEIRNNDTVRGVVFTSGKKDNFIAGADIGDIASAESKDEIRDAIADGMNFFEEMKSKGVPLVAAIDGSALGGGLEWALWCDYRVASASPKTKLGLPEVKLGLLPGFGGTQNLHSVVGLQAAMDMMLTGKEVRVDKAKKMGLVDLVADGAVLESVAIGVAEQLADGSLKVKKKKKGWMNWFVEDTPVGRNMMWKKVKEMVDKNTNGKYPAPYAIIDCVKHGLDNPRSKYEHERESFVKLAETKESEALIGIFEGMTAMKKHPFGDATATPVTTVGVLGAGLMGAGIAQVTAEKGYAVLLKDRDDQGVARGTDYIHSNWHKKVKRRRMTQYQYNINDSNLTPLTDDSPTWRNHFEKADVVIEAVFEDLNLKRQIVQMVEESTPPHCLFATNTSAIPISEIAKGAQRPQNVIGMHYFSPVPSMPLLEIIPHDGTSTASQATAFELGTKQGKTCIVVKDVPGFYVNRCLGPFLVEVTALVKDGVGLEALDSAMKDFGMPVGPITLADEVGIDVGGHVAMFLSNADLGVRMSGGDLSLMGNMIEKGWLGKKTKKGFYTYNGKKKTVSPEVKDYVKSFATRQLDLSVTDIQNRIVSRFVNEAAKCLEDEIIADPVVGDIGLVFGTGFAPFRGGPFRYLDTVGVQGYVDMMMTLREEYGEQFEPCDLLKDYAKSGKRFH
mmetsp:Transcript_63815/g.75531  ORF Transcript_63815/g.75531 Transcript_63815/m.75531 type:complete len:772 (+) Transcript_63815:113-2428(+)